jgi:hypothetical protein
MKRGNLKKDNRGKQIYSFFPHNIKFGPSFKRKHSQVRVKHREIQDPSQPRTQAILSYTR